MWLAKRGACWYDRRGKGRRSVSLNCKVLEKGLEVSQEAR